MVRKIAVGSGFELEIPSTYLKLKNDAEQTISSILAKYPKAMKMWELLRYDPEVNADWDMANYIAVAKLKYNDHGEVHAKVVAANALKMLQILLKYGILPDIMKEYAGDEDDAHLVVLTGALLHDIGNQVHRKDHNVSGVYLAIPLLNRLLPKVYEDSELMYEVRGHILHCIYAHEADVRDLTVEAALVGIADGTDMTKGRGRLAFSEGNVNIHTVSALSIENVEIVEGDSRPIKIVIEMSNSAGIFQVQETLAKKILNSPIKDYIEIEAYTLPPGATSDNRIVHRLVIKEGKFVAK